MFTVKHSVMYGHEKASVVHQRPNQRYSIGEMCLPNAQKPRFHAGLRECRYEHSDQKSQKIGR